MIEINPGPLDPDDSTLYTGRTPPETIADDLDSSPSEPCPESTFIIRSVSCGRYLTLLDGRIILAHQNDRSSIRWTCRERDDGWFGFQNSASGMYIGYSGKTLHCSAGRHGSSECFTFRPMPGGRYILLMTAWEKLWAVGIREENGVESLVRINKGSSGGHVWEFIKV